MATTKIVDFSNVKDGGNFNRKRIPAGDYKAQITKVDDAEAKDGVFQYLFSIKIVSRSSSVFPYYCKLTENQLWKLRNLLIAGGLTVPKKKSKVDVNRVVGKFIGVTVEDDDFDGKEQSTISAVFPAAELAGDDASADEDDEAAEEEEEEADLGDIDEPAEEAEDEVEEAEEAEEEEEAEDEDPLAALDRAGLKAEILKIDKTFQARKSQTDDDLREVLRGLQAKAAKPAAKKSTKAAAAEVSDDELEELDIDDL